jgi:hypothetical protein
MAVTAVLSCMHLTEVPEGTSRYDTATCPASGQEREIVGIRDDETTEGEQQ